MPRAGCSVPVHQQRWDTFPRSVTDPPACWSMLVHGLFCCFHPSSSPRPGPGSAPSSPHPPPQPWPGAQLGPGGQSYCKRPGRPQAWTLPAGRGRRHLPLPGSSSQGRILRPPSSKQAAPMAERGGREKTQALPRPCMCPQPASKPSAPPGTLALSPRLLLGSSPSLSLSPRGGAGPGRGFQQPDPLSSFKPSPSETAGSLHWVGE